MSAHNEKSIIYHHPTELEVIICSISIESLYASIAGEYYSTGRSAPCLQDHTKAYSSEHIDLFEIDKIRPENNTEGDSNHSIKNHIDALSLTYSKVGIIGTFPNF